jgi:hypothetical protein
VGTHEKDPYQPKPNPTQRFSIDPYHMCFPTLHQCQHVTKCKEK